MNYLTTPSFNSLFSQYSGWYSNMVQEYGVIPKSFAGVDNKGQQFISIIEELNLDHVERHYLIKTALAMEKSTVFAFATLVMAMNEGDSTEQERLQIIVGDAKSFIWGSWAVTRNGDCKAIALHHVSTLEGNDPENYPGAWFLTDALEIPESDKPRFREIWSQLRKDAQFKTH